MELPAGYELPAHHHPTAENVTVMSGNLHAGMGDKLDKAKGQPFTGGGFISVPAKVILFTLIMISLLLVTCRPLPLFQLYG